MRNKENNFPIHTLIWRPALPKDNQCYKRKMQNAYYVTVYMAGFIARFCTMLGQTSDSMTLPSPKTFIGGLVSDAYLWLGTP